MLFSINKTIVAIGYISPPSDSVASWEWVLVYQSNALKLVFNIELKSISKATYFLCKDLDWKMINIQFYRIKILRKAYYRITCIVMQRFDSPGVNNKMQIGLRFSISSISKIPELKLKLERDLQTLLFSSNQIWNIIYKRVF